MRYRLQRHDGTDCSATMVPITVLRMVPIQRYRQKYRCGLSGALPLGFVESAQYPHGALSKLPSLIEKQQKAVERIESEIPTLQDIICRQWSKADELSRLKQECKELQHRIDESLKETGQPQAAKHEAIAEAA